jgi:hypothetical protein
MTRAALGLLLFAFGKAHEDAPLVDNSALSFDDQCADSLEGECALNALQRRGKKLVEGVAANSSDPSCFATVKDYSLAFKAQGSSFFEGFTFMTVDDTHGAQQYLNKEEAIQAGVAAANETGATLRTGKVIPSTAPNAPFKRQSVMLHSNMAWSPSEGFVVVMKYNHVPWGAGIWPAFWLMNSDVLWPHGGEFDIMEYANDEPGKITFHTNKNCMLDGAKLAHCMSGKPIGGSGPHNCNTNYFQGLLGCRPQQVQRTGEWYSKNPGVLAAAWDESGVTVYHIPNDKIPDDLANEAPKPETWSDFVLAHLPFNKETCQDVAKPQEIVLNIALCGDWAGNAWFRSPAARRTGYTHGCSAILSNPKADCCSQFVTENTPRVNNYMQNRAYFDIDYIKVFTPHGQKLPPLMSGTFRRGGAPLEG